jgi:hypothetical protein
MLEYESDYSVFTDLPTINNTPRLHIKLLQIIGTLIPMTILIMLTPLLFINFSQRSIYLKIATIAWSSFFIYFSLYYLPRGVRMESFFGGIFNVTTAAEWYPATSWLMMPWFFGYFIVPIILTLIIIHFYFKYTKYASWMIKAIIIAQILIAYFLLLILVFQVNLLKYVDILLLRLSITMHLSSSYYYELIFMIIWQIVVLYLAGIFDNLLKTNDQKIIQE